jgi:hypothetical protein
LGADIKREDIFSLTNDSLVGRVTIEVIITKKGDAKIVFFVGAVIATFLMNNNLEGKIWKKEISWFDVCVWGQV